MRLMKFESWRREGSRWAHPMFRCLIPNSRLVLTPQLLGLISFRYSCTDPSSDYQTVSADSNFLQSLRPDWSMSMASVLGFSFFLKTTCSILKRILNTLKIKTDIKLSLKIKVLYVCHITCWRCLGVVIKITFQEMFHVLWKRTMSLLHVNKSYVFRHCL